MLLVKDGRTDINFLLFWVTPYFPMKIVTFPRLLMDCKSNVQCKSAPLVGSSSSVILENDRPKSIKSGNKFAPNCCSATKYFYYYSSTNELKLVSKKVFLKGEYPVISNETAKIKVVGLPSGYNKKRLNWLLFEAQKFKAEGVCADFMDTLSLIKDVLHYLATIKNGLEKLGRVVDMNLVLRVLSLLIKFQTCFTNGLQLNDVILSLIDLYLLVTDFKDRFKAEMLEEVCLASLSMLLPNQLFEIIRRINVFSSSKLCDDISGVHKIFSLFFDAILYILNLFPESYVVDYLKRFIEDLKGFGIHSDLYVMNKLISEEKVGEKLIKLAFRNKIKDFHNNLNHGAFKQWARKSASVAASYLDFCKLYKRVVSYEECARQEPIGIVFQGPPGCGKSRAMNAVVQGLPWSKYVHQVKDTNDGKDFYDMYENETIFYMDDVGQQGISQWRTFINMISEVKYPLDCARAENKDTKFFNSDVVLATTNEFMNLSGLVRTDCIRELPALWRRCLVLDFEKVKFDGTYVGRACWRFYNLDKREFQLGFPSHLLKVGLNEIPPVFELNGNDLDFYAWICRTIKVLRQVNLNRLISNKLSDSQLDYIRQKCDFDAEGIFNWSMNSSKSCEDSAMWYERVSGESLVNDCDTEDLDAKLQRLRENLYDSLGDEQIKGERNNPLATFKSFILDGCKWLLDMLKRSLTRILESEDFPQFMAFFITIVLSYGVMYVVDRYCQGKMKSSENGYVAELDVAKNFDFMGGNTYQQSVRKALKEVVVTSACGTKVNVIGLLSGHCVLLPSHSIITEVVSYLTVFNDKKDGHIIYDKVPIKVLYLNRAEDVAIVELPRNTPTVFRKMAKGFKTESSKCVLVSPFGISDSCAPFVVNKNSPIVYKIPFVDGGISNTIVGDHFSYPVRGNGLCGSLVVGNNCILGMHVAGNEAKGVGVAIRWSENTVERLFEILNADKELIAFDMSEKILANSSVLKINQSLNVSVPTKSNFATTPLYSIFPVTRFPAELCKFGKCTVKDIAKKSFGHTVTVPSSELEFGKKVMRDFLRGSTFSILTEEQIIGGTDLLAGLNRKSSNGYKCLPKKEDYIDFENNSFHPDFKTQLSDLESNIEKDIIDWEKFVWVEMLKDELRNVEKEGTPRSFRVGTIHHQVLMKKYFGWLVCHIMSNRRYNNIMVGMNPFVEWPEMYDNLRACKGVFAGDIAKWDGSMNNMVQDAIKEVILEFVPNPHKKICRLILDNAIRSIVAVQDDLYVTTHSMPSGHYLTAILNSMVNRFYTAMWYEREIGDGNTVRFVSDIIDYVYGDDKLVGVKSNIERLHAISMLAFFNSLGMGFTDSLKKDIDTPFQTLDDVTFLKRYFRYHDELKRIVCPLELRTLQSGLSFYDKTKDLDIVMKAKIDTYQRECYLWPERDILLRDFKQRLETRGFLNQMLSRDYLYNIYQDPASVILELSWGGSIYI